MKKVFITFLCLSVSAIVANAQDNKTTAPAASTAAQQTPPPPPPAPKPNPKAGVFKFKEETHDFGEVPEGPQAEVDFEFKNVGKEPIVIQEAHGSCGCTVPKWPQEPILPGEKGKIHVTYNTQGRPGPIMKDVTINSNAQQSPMVLHIRGNVKPKPADPAPAQAPVATPAPAPANSQK
jgi:hypothetical protein